MGERLLLGVPVPDGAVRVVIRPILGRGGALPLYESALDGPLPTETDVIVSASRNAAFWEYIDAQVKAKRIGADAFSWKLRIAFFNQLHVENATCTEQAFEFYRSASASRAGGRKSTPFKQSMRVLKAVQRSCLRSVRRVAEFSQQAIAETAKACAGAQAEASKAAGTALAEASKQTVVVGELAKALLAETGELKEAIFELQTERVKTPPPPPKTFTDELKDLHATAKTLMGLADTFAPAPAPATTPAPAPDAMRPPQAPRPDGPTAEKKT